MAKQTSYIRLIATVSSASGPPSLCLILCVSLGITMEVRILARTGPDGLLDVRQAGVHAGLR